MKKIIKYIIKIFTKVIISFLSSINSGRYFIDELSKNILTKKKIIKHKELKFNFHIPNRLNYFRVNTFSSKEPETLNWIDTFAKQNVFWDIGANIGLYSCYAAKRADSKVYAFEPSVFNLELLAKNIYINSLSDKITIIPFPLIDNIKETEFNMSSIEWGGSISTFGEDYKHDGSILEKKFRYKMVGLSMNECVNYLKIKQPDYIKIDVDGVEHLILKGGNQILKKTKSLLVEVDEKFISQAEKIKKYLTESGFKLIEKKHSDLIEKSKFKSVFNQIWEKV